MCGISGYFSSKNTIDTELFYDAHLLMKHRGPDDEGFLVTKNSNEYFQYKGNDTVSELTSLPHIKQSNNVNMILGHRRLSIIDLSPKGHQPIIHDRYSMVFNGEIYNYIELKKELREKGHSFTSDSDTEVALHSFEEWGTDCFNKFNGMWALAIYDNLEKKLVLSRDRFAIKPLYYHLGSNGIYFASEIKVIKTLIDKTTIDENTAKKFIDFGTLNIDENTFYNEIKELKQSHYLIFDGESATEYKQYWNFKPHRVSYSENEANDMFEELFENSIKLRMRSDVEVGSLLSGGLDSTTIVGSLNKLGYLKDIEFKTFTTDYKEKEFSEVKYVKDTESMLPIESYYDEISGEKMGAYINDALYHLEEPFGTLSIVSQYILYEFIKKNTNVKVVLNGQGADECYGGYAPDYYTLFINYYLSGQFKKAHSEYKEFKKHRKVGYRQFVFSLLRSFKYGLGHKNFFNTTLFRQFDTVKLKNYLKNDDRNSMAFGIEARSPFLDYKLVEFAFTLDERYKINNFENKKIVRDYSRGVIPESIINRKDKTGFITPQEVWQHTILKPDMDKSFQFIRKNGLLNYNGNTLYKRYANYANKKSTRWSYFWRIFCTQRWLENQ